MSTSEENEVLNIIAGCLDKNESDPHPLDLCFHHHGITLRQFLNDVWWAEREAAAQKVFIAKLRDIREFYILKLSERILKL